jgi:hypothetical protein
LSSNNKWIRIKPTCGGELLLIYASVGFLHIFVGPTHRLSWSTDAVHSCLDSTLEQDISDFGGGSKAISSRHSISLPVSPFAHVVEGKSFLVDVSVTSGSASLTSKLLRLPESELIRPSDWEVRDHPFF